MLSILKVFGVSKTYALLGIRGTFSLISQATLLIGAVVILVLVFFPPTIAETNQRIVGTGFGSILNIGSKRIDGLALIALITGEL